MRTPFVEFEEKIPQDITGGYVIGSFDVMDAEGETLIAEYRFVHQYGYLQDPELHEFILKGSEGYQIRNVKFGHSYGLLRGDDLWRTSQPTTPLSVPPEMLTAEPPRFRSVQPAILLCEPPEMLIAVRRAASHPPDRATRPRRP